VKTTLRPQGCSFNFISKRRMDQRPDEQNREFPQFDLSVENELLKLKLRAEFGAECTTAAHHNIPDEVVHEFLQSVYAFEKQFREVRKPIRVYDKIGRPYFLNHTSLDDEQVARELRRITSRMQACSLALNVLGKYPDRQIYRFITEEFFEVEMEDVEMPGFTHHFCYEDFYPNHEIEIRERIVELLSLWFGRQLSVTQWPLPVLLQSYSGITVHQDLVLQKMKYVLDSYVAFRNCEYRIDKLKIEWSKSKAMGIAYVSGHVRYDGLLDDGNVHHIEGPFSMELRNSDDWWKVSFFELPGIEWS
jgi:hypothetical protein